MNNTSNLLLAKFQNEPALIGESQRPWFEACVAKTSEMLAVIESKEVALDDFWSFDDNDRWMTRVRPYNVTDGVLRIPINGLLLNKFPYATTWATGYEYIWEAVKRGLDDSNVNGIALVIDSPGGLVAGNFDLIDKIYARRGEKPIKAYASESAYSAAYAIASVADDITVSRTGGVGSIGVVVIHTEISRNLEANGVSVDIIRSKPGKMEGSYYEALQKAARKRIQARVDEFHKQFVALVARNRNMDESVVDDTNALTFMAEEAIEEGLADHVGSLEDSLTAFVATLNSQEGDDTMATAKVDTIPITEHESAVTTASDTARSDGHASGVADERARVSTINASDEAKDRPQATRALVDAGMDAELAVATLGKMPKESASVVDSAPPGAGAPAGMLGAAMDGTPNPELGAGIENDDADEDSDAELMVNIANYGLSGFKAQKGA